MGMDEKGRTWRRHHRVVQPLRARLSPFGRWAGSWQMRVQSTQIQGKASSS